MSLLPTEPFPNGSKSQLNRAGDKIRASEAGLSDTVTIERWRAAHRPVLNTFQAILRGRTRSKDIIVAQRHKRKRTIADKLTRFPKMKLSRMDDVAGCRLIFKTIDELYEFRDSLHAARFNHELKNALDKYDYIKSPKDSGYRGVHDVYSYNVSTEQPTSISNGLLIELQYRTLHQHAWATCVEVIGFITENQPKFERGDDRFREIFRVSSEIIARAFENRNSCLPDVDDGDLVRQFIALDEQLNFMSLLKGLNEADGQISNRKNVILIFSDDLEIETYKDATEALRALFKLEKENPDKDVVLVRADTSEEVRIAFRNYFSDATEFIRLIDDGCRVLSGRYSEIATQ